MTKELEHDERTDDRKGGTQVPWTGPRDINMEEEVLINADGRKERTGRPEC